MAMEIERPIEDREDRVDGVIMGWELWETAVGSDGQEPFGFVIFLLIIFLFCLFLYDNFWVLSPMEWKRWI